jgi:hypothetical protein
MRIRLKGINRVGKRLADGTTRTYWYAWKGGPPLRGEPGSPEFIASYNEAAARKVTPLASPRRRARTKWKPDFVHGPFRARGRLYCYFRKPGCKNVPLPLPVGSAEFWAAYQAALAGIVKSGLVSPSIAVNARQREKSRRTDARRRFEAKAAVQALKLLGVSIPPMGDVT